MKKVLVIDDEPGERLVVKGLLEDRGYEVVTGKDANEALEACRSQNPDIVIMDVRLPGKDGIEASREINEISSAAVILLTGADDEETVRRAAGAGVMAYLVKPVKEEDLFAAIELAALRRGEFEKLKKENKDLKNEIESRKLVEKAKGLLMAKEGLTEEEAFSRLRKISMDKRKSMKEIAEVIILAFEKKAG